MPLTVITHWQHPCVLWFHSTWWARCINFLVTFTTSTDSLIS